MIGEGDASLAARNTRWGAMLIEELSRAGVPLICACPGSRSTPLTAALAARADLKQRVMFDERGAAFFALGVGRATGRPAALITTSGTAMANAYPAVIEAERAGVPLLLLSTDRPAELRESGANQTIDQIKLFGDRVRWYAEILSPDSGFPTTAALTTIDEAVHRTRHPIPGPVHLNLQFREPLGPEDIGAFPDDPRLERWTHATTPWTQIGSASPAVAPMPAILTRTTRGLLVAGEGAGPAAASLAKALGWPMFADVTAHTGDSQMRLPMFDYALASSAFQRALAPEAILHIGGAVVSKRYRRWISVHPPTHHLTLRADPRRHDPDHTVTQRLVADPTATIHRWLDDLETPAIDTTWRDALLDATHAACGHANRVIQEAGALTEPLIAQTIAAADAPIFLGNSMPIRDADLFGAPIRRSAMNRGASGIDGLVATAAGWATGMNEHTIALLGDLSTLHDLSSMAILAQQSVPLTVVVVNNGGGGIFSFLPVSTFDAGFETHFATAHDFDFADIARAFRLPYVNARVRTELEEGLRADGRTTLIEVQTNRTANAALHRQILRETIAILETRL
ncbi:MAG: 2-succinyl-5-enolpyruvyl-6-hydroxy-3-cyclohexene-1-carboxylic-acid synthase [Myxococcota bacterium]